MRNLFNFVFPDLQYCVIYYRNIELLKAEFRYKTNLGILNVPLVLFEGCKIFSWGIVSEISQGEGFDFPKIEKKNPELCSLNII